MTPDQGFSLPFPGGEARAVRTSASSAARRSPSHVSVSMISLCPQPVYLFLILCNIFACVCLFPSTVIFCCPCSHEDRCSFVKMCLDSSQSKYYMEQHTEVCVYNDGCGQCIQCSQRDRCWARLSSFLPQHALICVNTGALVTTIITLRPGSDSLIHSPPGPPEITSIDALINYRGEKAWFSLSPLQHFISADDSSLWSPSLMVKTVLMTGPWWRWVMSSLSVSDNSLDIRAVRALRSQLYQLLRNVTNTSDGFCVC